MERAEIKKIGFKWLEKTEGEVPRFGRIGSKGWNSLSEGAGLSYNAREARHDKDLR
jgi:hypothetical protein